jgi:phospholipase/carboxylesterase
MERDLIVQQPDAQADVELVLLFHGVGSSAEDLRAVGQAIAAKRPRAWVISVCSPDPSDFGRGWQWFSVQGVTETNRPDRVATAMPRFVEKAVAWQRHTGVTPERTTLIGFSQGAIMALESTQRQGIESVAARVIAIAGRFAKPPRVAPERVVVHLMHGEQDHVMPVGLSVDAHRTLQELGAVSTLDMFAGLGHGIDNRVVDAILQRLETAQQEPSR